MHAESRSKAFGPFARGAGEIAAEALRRTEGTLVPTLLVGLVLVELVLFGGDRRELALSIAGLQALVAAGLLGAKRWAGRGRRPPPGLSSTIVLFAALCAWELIQLAPIPLGMAKAAWNEVGTRGSITLDRFATLVELAKLLGLGAVLLAGAILARSRRASAATMAALGLGGGVYAAWAVASYYVPALGGEVSPHGRLSASQASPNVLAAALGVFAVLGSTKLALFMRDLADADLETMLREWTRPARLAWAGLTAISLWGVALTGSRGGAAAMALGLSTTLVAVWLTGSKSRRSREAASRYRQAVGLLLALAVAVLASAGALLARLAPEAVQANDRLDYFTVYLAHLKDVPWTGFGLGTFQRFNTLLVSPTPRMWSWQLGAMHNLYLQWFYEAGPVGALLMFAVVVSALWRISQGLRQSRSGRAWMASGLGVSALLALHGLVDIDLQFPGVASLWALMLGMGVGSAAPRR